MNTPPVLDTHIWIGWMLGDPSLSHLERDARGPKPKLCASQLLTSLVYHLMNGSGVFSEHVFQLLGVRIKDSSLSERRQRIGFEPFAWLMKHALRPMADEQIDKSCFYKGLRLCGIDGSRWSVTNTPQILGKMTKAASRRFEAAFAKVEMCVLVELALHHQTPSGWQRAGQNPSAR